MSRVFAAVLFTFWACTVIAQDFSALARLNTDQSGITDKGRNEVAISLSLSQGLPWRIFTLDNPYRLVMDFREIDWTGVSPKALDKSRIVDALHLGTYRPGWSRLVAHLDQPMKIETAEMRLNAEIGTAQIEVRLAQSDADSFAARAGAPKDPRWDLPEPSVPAVQRQPTPDWAPTIVVLDPGHGGIDPGAERGGVQEKQLMLQFARELRDTLRRAGNFEVILTRTDDRFVSLEARVALAHQVDADLFISLHADTVQQGQAHGTTVYTLAEDASDAATQYLAERHNRADVLAGIDLSGTDDQIANVLLDLARRETAPRSRRLAEAMVLGMQGTVGELNRKPYRYGAFSVLKAADIPSVLIETGFMSSPRDLANLKDVQWRQALAEGIRDGLQAWIVADNTARALARQ